MARQVDVEALRQVVSLLGTYISDVNQDVLKMQDAAVDCGDNMGNDELSNLAIKKLEECVKDLSKITKEAEELKKKIIKEIKRIEQLRGRS